MVEFWFEDDARKMENDPVSSALASSPGRQPWTRSSSALSSSFSRVVRPATPCTSISRPVDPPASELTAPVLPPPSSIIPFNPHRQVPVIRRDPTLPSPPQMPFAVDAPPFMPNGPEGWSSPGGTYSDLPPIGGLALGFGEIHRRPLCESR